MSNGNQTFAIDVRVLQCGNCGAPLQAPVGGGNVSCEYCGTATQVAPRPDLHVAAPPTPGATPGGGAAPAVDEQQRIFMLHQQAVSYDPHASPYAFYFAPAGLEHLVTLDNKYGSKHPETLEKATAEFNKALAACRAHPNDPMEQRRVYWLASFTAQLWSAHKEYLRQRATLETADELMQDPGHRYMLTVALAGAARNRGELDAADAWFATLDPRPMHLDLDCAYRVGRASVALVRGQYDQALQLIGRSEAEAPMEPSRVALSKLIRAAALEGVGEPARAEAELKDLSAKRGRQVVDEITDVNDSLGMAKAAWQRLDQRGEIPKKKGPKGRRGPVALLLRLGVPMLLLPLALLFSPQLSALLGSSMGYHQPVMARLQSCPAAVAVLGQNIRPAVVGLSCGNAESEGATGHASWGLPVRGSQGSGRYEFTVQRYGGPWQLMAGTLTAEGQTIDIANCATTPAMPAVVPAPVGVPVAPVAPVAPVPGAAAPTPPVSPPVPAALPATPCQRLRACCAVSGANPHVTTICATLPQIEATSVADRVCTQHLGAVASIYRATGGALPAACR